MTAEIDEAWLQKRLEWIEVARRGRYKDVGRSEKAWMRDFAALAKAFLAAQTKRWSRNADV